MNANEWLEQELENLLKDYEEGNPLAVHEAIMLSMWNSVPIPEWAIPWLEQVLKLHAEGSFKRKKGVVSDTVAAQRYRHDLSMHGQVKWLLSLAKEDWRNWAGSLSQTQNNAFHVVAQLYTEANRNGPNRKIVTEKMVKAVFYRTEKRGSK